MTEREWLKSRDPEVMSNYYGKRHRERKARLLMLACCRRHPSYLETEAVRVMVDLLTSHYADPRKPDKPFDSPKARTLYGSLEAFASSTRGGPIRGLAFGVVAATEPRSIMKRLVDSFRYLVFSCTHDVAAGFGSLTSKSHRAEQTAQANLVREVFGNPFRRVVIKPAWLTSNVVALARQAYQSEDFSLMPILADALQDSGCEDEAILNHCRNEKLVHVRGCWLLDRLIGKK